MEFGRIDQRSIHIPYRRGMIRRKHFELPLDSAAMMKVDELPSFVVETHCPGGRLILGRGVEQW